VFSQCEIAYGRLKRGLPQFTRKPNDSDLTITLGNGAQIVFRSGENPDRLYGEDVYAAVIDEASRMREESWHAIRSTLTATHGPVRIIGNVKGRKNWAYRLARRAESGDADMHYSKITAYDAVDAGILSAGEVEDARAVLPAHVFKELYEAEPSDDQGNPFGIDAIHACIAPESDEPAAWWGWDLAKSVDWTVGIGLDKHGRVSEFHRFQADWRQTNLRIRSVTESVPALVDATGVGDPVVEELQRTGGNYEAFKFSSTSKQQLMEGLAVAIQQREISYPDGPIVNELDAFEYVFTRTGVTYSAPEGLHDDCVIALALAVMCKQRVAVPNVRFISW
jgi:phage FluMu gp28-like protein